MERLIINIPEKKSALVKKMLEGFGVSFQGSARPAPSGYREKISKVSTWTAEETTVFEETKKAFDSLKPHSW